MGTRLLFRLILYPLSWLPLPVLYGISRIFYGIIAYMVKYRSSVIENNLRASFPEMTDREIREVKKKNYRFLSEMAAEMIKMLSMSKAQLRKRYYCTNPEMVNQFYDQGKSVILMSAHYNNWEWMILSLNDQFKHHGVGVGAPNSNKVFEKMINHARTRYGTTVVFADTIRAEFRRRYDHRIYTSYMMLADQSPPHPDKCYITRFLNQPSGVIFGPEYNAKKFDIPVLYYEVIRDRKGYYHIEVKLITEDPQNTAYGEITETYIRLLENTIRSKPEYWLWTHRRWKHTITSDR